MTFLRISMHTIEIQTTHCFCTSCNERSTFLKRVYKSHKCLGTQVYFVDSFGPNFPTWIFFELLFTRIKWNRFFIAPCPGNK